jgi:hypothetical protein
MEYNRSLGDIRYKIRVGVLTARRVVDVVIRYDVHDKTAEADNHCDQTEREYTR